MRDVALRAGVSQRTVSNVVNHAPYVSVQTRERVEKAMAELGFRPNAAARSLRLGRSDIVALVVPELDSPYFSALAAQLSVAAEEHGWTLLVEQSHGDPERERRLLDGVRAQMVDGVFFSPWGLGPEDLRGRRDHAPLVLLGEHVDTSVADHVIIDNELAARDATAHLVSVGRRRIAAVGTRCPVAREAARLRRGGWARALAEAGVPHDPALEVPVTSLHRDAGAAAVRRLLDDGVSFDALFCFTDELALGALHVLLSEGVRVPQDVALVGFDDIEDGRYATPTLTTVSPDLSAIAREAAGRLALRLRSLRDSARLHDEEEPAHQGVIVPHQLVVRSSSGPG
ncbi:DNA-binding LacI/PurR family transcriptional regulator [Motilibacter peucedani]|uniref:DNA-binding LacI/PurR family transcriptional regulator n=1 Tax=Motilibacter peucedani TaxID=598650 RepID=A0A420XND6_9ACTN|nr:LacI family DNA-binding transcriptional regulator [Motilibacter peucedani]RKS72800.1 DNA-binding LacI/PurR family transcriptional regulator [Motilibacter peucedani]